MEVCSAPPPETQRFANDDWRVTVRLPSAAAHDGRHRPCSVLVIRRTGKFVCRLDCGRTKAIRKVNTNCK